MRRSVKSGECDSIARPIASGSDLWGESATTSPWQSHTNSSGTVIQIGKKPHASNQMPLFSQIKIAAQTSPFASTGTCAAP